MIRFEIECSGPHLDFFVCDLSHFTEDWKGKHTLARNQEKFLKPAKRLTTSDVSGKRACEISTVTKGWKTRTGATNQIRSLAWLTQT